MSSVNEAIAGALLNAWQEGLSREEANRLENVVVSRPTDQTSEWPFICPKCGGKMQWTTFDEEALRLLTGRSEPVECEKCGFDQDTVYECEECYHQEYC